MTALDVGALADGVAVNEARVNAIGTGRHWLAQWLARRPHNVALPTIAGAVVWLPCLDEDDARDTVDLMVRHGVPRTAVSATRLDRDGAIPLRALRAIGCLKLRGPLPLDPEGWLR